ncbi:PKD domain-containing protein [Natrinema sp. LN54]|uniref:PKD domain-containing protein n=1 Tax=Natrinema sp. LN54 TaxID=3458705 RepID=UPI0040375991
MFGDSGSTRRSVLQKAGIVGVAGTGAFFSSNTVTASSTPVPVMSVENNDELGRNLEVGDTVTLSGTQSVDPDGGSLSYQWTVDHYDEGLLAGGSDETFEYQFEHVGNHVIGLSVETDGGNREFTTWNVTVIDGSPEDGMPFAGIDIDTPLEVGTSTTLEAYSRVTDPEIEAADWRIVYNSPDRTERHVRRSGMEIEYTFDQPGEYLVEVNVEGDNGEESFQSKFVEVSGSNSEPPVPIMTVANEDDLGQNLEVGDTIELSGTRSDASAGGSLSYQWTVDHYDKGLLAGGSDGTFEYQFEHVGNHVIGLSVETETGHQEFTTWNVTVIDDRPEDGIPFAGIDIDTPVDVGTSTTLEAYSRVTDPGIQSADWRIIYNSPDRTERYVRRSGMEVEYTFDQPGEYLVEVNVEGDNGEESFQSTFLQVADPNREPPVPELEIEPESDIFWVGDTVTFDGSNSSDPEGGSLEYQWIVEHEEEGLIDGVSEESFEYTFEMSGEHYVSLTVENEVGQREWDSTTVTAIPSDY